MLKVVLRSLGVGVRRAAIVLDDGHILLLLLIAPFLLFPSPARSPVLLVVPGLWLIALLAGRQPLLRTPLNGPVLALTVMVLVSTWATYDLTVSLPKIAGMVLGIGVFYAFVRYGRRTEEWTWCLLAFLIAGLGVGILGLLGTKWSAKFPLLQPITVRLAPQLLGWQGAEGGFHPNEVAGALLWVIPVFSAVSWVAIRGEKRHTIPTGKWLRLGLGGLFLIVTLFLILVLVLTQSRAAYIGLALTCLLAVAGRLAIQPQWRRLVLGLMVAGALAVGIAAWQYGTNTLLRGLFDSNANATGEPVLALNTLEGRMELWSRAIYGLQDFPFTGMGMNTFRRVVHILYPLFLTAPDTDIGHAHNELLQAGLDLGIPGVVAFVALYTGAFAMLLRVVASGHWVNEGGGQTDDPIGMAIPVASWLLTPHAAAILAWGLGGGLLAHAIYGLMDAVALGAKPGVLFWMLLGLITGLYQWRTGK